LSEKSILSFVYCKTIFSLDQLAFLSLVALKLFICAVYPMVCWSPQNHLFLTVCFTLGI